VIQSIGKGGVVGSSQETKTRESLDWRHENAYLIPSNGGKAIGWIHIMKKNNESKNNNNMVDVVPPVVLMVFKIPALQQQQQSVDQPGTEHGDNPSFWPDQVRRECMTLLNQNKSDTKTTTATILPLSSSGTRRVREICKRISQEKQS